MTFVKGHPKFGGRAKGVKNKKPKDIVLLAQKYTTEALAKIVKTMRHSADEELATRMALKLIERGHGGTPLPIRIGDAHGDPLNFADLGSITDEQLERLAGRLEQYLSGAANLGGDPGGAGEEEGREGDDTLH